MKIPKKLETLWQQRNNYNGCIDIFHSKVSGQLQRLRTVTECENANIRKKAFQTYSDLREATIEEVAKKCAWFIVTCNDIRTRIEEILVRPITSAQTKRPVEIMVDGRDKCSWVFFRTTHPVLSEGQLTFNGSHSQLSKQTPMVKELFRIPGVAEVALMRYDVRITKGSLFTVAELSPKIIEVLRKYLV